MEGNMSIKEQVILVKESIKDYPNINIIAATKYMDLAQTKELVDAGINNLGENRTDMFLEKYEALKNNKEINWHFLGYVQSRKIRDIVNKITCLHSLDRLSLAIELNKRLTNPLDCFVQINISEEPNKQGIPANKLKTFLKQLASCDKIRIVGLMCVAQLTFDKEELKEQFNKMKELQKEVQEMALDYAPCDRLSMGMSNDYLLAIECGATDIRLGRIFLK